MYRSPHQSLHWVKVICQPHALGVLPLRKSARYPPNRREGRRLGEEIDLFAQPGFNRLSLRVVIIPSEIFRLRS